MVKIMCIGDWGHTAQSWMVEKIRRYNTNVIFFLGDNFYPNGISSEKDPQWEKLKVLFHPSIPKYGCLGNHDYIGDPYKQILSEESNFHIPHFFHKVYLGKKNIMTLFIDSQLFAPDITIPLLEACFASASSIDLYKRIYHMEMEKQLQWLEYELQHSKSRWNFVCAHYPIFSNGPHEVSPVLQSRLFSIFKKYKVDLYLSGHDHNIQCIKKQDFMQIISGGLFPEGYEIFSIKDSDTIFTSSNPGFIMLEIGGPFLYIYNHNLITEKDELVHMIRKHE